MSNAFLTSSITLLDAIMQYLHPFWIGGGFCFDLLLMRTKLSGYHVPHLVLDRLVSG